MPPRAAPRTSDQAAVDVAFVCAMALELAPLAERLGLEEVDDAGPARIWLGRADRRPVAGVVTGMGPVRAHAGISAALRALRPTRVAVVGIAGALGNDTPIGEVLQVTVVIDGATGRRYLPDGGGSGRGTPGHGTASADGALWTAGTVVTDPQELARLRGLGVIALDMETAAVAEACQARGIPWSVFRAVSDQADDGAVEEYVAHLSHPDGTPDEEAMARYLARHPERVPALTGLVEGAARGARAAATAALRASLPRI